MQNTFSCFDMSIMSLRRFSMHHVQMASVDRSKSLVTFETRDIHQRRFYFTLTREQFLAFDDVIQLLKREDRYGHFPLGDDMWFHYSEYGGKIYEYNRDAYWKFISLTQYKKHVHQRLMSFFRCKDEWVSHPQRGRKRRLHRRRVRAMRDDDIGDEDQYPKSSKCKRTLSTSLCPSTQSSASGSACEWEASPRPTDNVLMSPIWKESAFLSKREHSSSGRKNDVRNSPPTPSKDFSFAQSPLCEVSDSPLSASMDCE